MKYGQSVKHLNRKLHDAWFAGYTKSGRVRVIYNYLHPWGVGWRQASYKSENIEAVTIR